MKKVLLYIAFIYSVALTGQNPIILNQVNMPFYPQVFRVMGDLKSEISLPETGQNKTWDYTNLALVPSYNYGFFPAKNPFFPTATYVDTPDISGILYDHTFIYNTYCKTDESGVSALGSETRNQVIDLSSYTGSPNDRIVIPEQHCIYSKPVKIVSFPLSVGTSWHSSYRSYVDYTVTMESFSLFNAQFRRVSYTTRTDSVTGWGKVLVPSHSGSSAPVNALMVYRANIQRDSFYINGVPASDDLLKSFCLSQGKVNINNKYLFWHENAAYPVLVVHFGSNNFTKPIGAHYDGNIGVKTGLSENELVKDDIQVYPNPNDGRFTIEFTGLLAGNTDIQLYDMLGKEFYSSASNIPENGSNLINVQVNKIPKGEYFLVIKNAGQKFLNKIVIW